MNELSDANSNGKEVERLKLIIKEAHHIIMALHEYICDNNPDEGYDEPFWNKYSLPCHSKNKNKQNDDDYPYCGTCPLGGMTKGYKYPFKVLGRSEEICRISGNGHKRNFRHNFLGDQYIVDFYLYNGCAGDEHVLLVGVDDNGQRISYLYNRMGFFPMWRLRILKKRILNEFKILNGSKYNYVY